MIASQRRAHRVFWLFAAPLLLLLAVVLFLARPSSPGRADVPQTGSNAGGQP